MAFFFTEITAIYSTESCIPQVASTLCPLHDHAHRTKSVRLAETQDLEMAGRMTMPVSSIPSTSGLWMLQLHLRTLLVMVSISFQLQQQEAQANRWLKPHHAENYCGCCSGNPAV